jgi:WD40 repeat protein
MSRAGLNIFAIVTSFFVFGAQLPAWSEELTTETMQRAARRVLQLPLPEMTPLQGQVRLDAEMFSVVDGRVYVTARPLWNMPLHKQAPVLASLERLLQAILTNSFFGTSLATPAEAKDLVANSTVRFGPPVTLRYLDEITFDDLLQAVAAYINHLDRTKTWSEKGLITLKDFRLFGEEENQGIRYSYGLTSRLRSALLKQDGTLQWNVGIASKEKYYAALPAPSNAVWNAARRANWEAVNQFLFKDVPAASQEYFDRCQSLLHELLFQALAVFEDPRTGHPLLEPTAAKSLVVKVNAQSDWEPHYRNLQNTFENALRRGGTWAAAPGPPGAPQVLQNDESARNAAKDFKPLTLKEVRVSDTPPAAPAYVAPDTEAFAAAGPSSRQPIVDLQGGAVYALDFSPDGRWLASAGEVLRIWDLQSRQIVRVLRAGGGFAGAGSFSDARFTPDGKSLVVAVAGTSRGLQVYETGDMAEVRETIGGHTGAVRKLAFSPGGQYLATVGEDNVLIIWDWPARQKLKAYRSPVAITHLSFTSNADIFVVGNLLQSAVISVLEGVLQNVNGTPVQRAVEQMRQEVSDFYYASAMSVSRDGSFVAAGGYTERAAAPYPDYWCRAQRVQAAPQKQAAARVQSVGHKHTLTASALNHDGTLCASADVTGRVVVWKTASGEILFQSNRLAPPNYSASFGDSPTTWRFGRRSYDLNDTPRWDVNCHGPLHLEFDLLRRQLRAIDPFPPVKPTLDNDGYSLRYDSGKRVLTSTKKPAAPALLPLAQGEPDWLIYSYLKAPSRPLYALLGDEGGGLALVDGATLWPKCSFIGHSYRLWSAAPSTGDDAGRFLISTAGDGLIHIWSLENIGSRYSVGVTTDNHGIITHIYPTSPARGRLAVGDRLETINGLSPRDWLTSPQAAAVPKGLAQVGFRRGNNRYAVAVPLSDVGDLRKPLLSAVFSESGQDWLVWTQSGYYDCSPNGHDLIGWIEDRGPQRAARYLSGSQVRETFHRRDVIDLVMSLGSEAEAVKQANATHLAIGAPLPPAATTPSPMAAIPEPPKVRFRQPPEKTIQQTGDEVIDVEVAVVAPPGPRPSVEFFVNGSVIEGRDYTPETLPASAAANADTFVVRQKIPLQLGENRIRAVAALPDIRTDARTSYVTVHRREELKPGYKPRLIVLAAGINKYANEDLPSLSFAVADAESFGSTLKQRWSNQSAAEQRYREVVVMPLLDEKAAASDLRRAFDSLTLQTQPGDTVLILISSHGATYGPLNNFCLVPYGGDPKRPSETCITWAELIGVSQSLPNRRLVLFIDSCRSAALAGGNSASAAIFGGLFNGVVFAACGSKQQALENPKWRHGAFTLALLEAIENKQLVPGIAWEPNIVPDPDGNGIEIEELAKFIRSRVQQLTGGDQAPNYCKQMDVDPFLF